MIKKLKVIWKLLKSHEYFVMTTKHHPFKIVYDYDSNTNRDIFYKFLKSYIEENKK